MYYEWPPIPYVYPPVYGYTVPHHFNEQEIIDRKKKEAEKQPTEGHTLAHYGATSCKEKHTHLHPGVTSTPIETEEGHVHKIYGNTTFDDEHIHYYETYTSPPIELPDGYHTHYVEIKTTKNDGHQHVIKGFTAPSKS